MQGIPGSTAGTTGAPRPGSPSTIGGSADAGRSSPTSGVLPGQNIGSTIGVSAVGQLRPTEVVDPTASSKVTSVELHDPSSAEASK